MSHNRKIVTLSAGKDDANSYFRRSIVVERNNPYLVENEPEQIPLAKCGAII
jgi:hypothetical protein